MAANDLKQVAAALALGVNQSTVGRALSATGQPSLRLLIALSRKTKKTVGQLLGLAEAEPYPFAGAMMQQLAELRQELQQLRRGPSEAPKRTTVRPKRARG